MRKGIVLAGGSGTRLYPLTSVTSKQLLPVYDKPMVYYPLSTLMLAGIREILIISTPEDLPNFKRLLGDGSQWGVTFSYAEQTKPEGIAQALVIAGSFIGADSVCLVLGDNIFYGDSLTGILQNAAARECGATIFGYYVKDPERYGVAELNDAGEIVGIEEKPRTPRSPYAITGIYFYDNQAVSIAAGLKRSSRGEFEITDLNNYYLQRRQLSIELLGRGMAWLDAGTHHSLHAASNFIETIERRQGLKISCPEEIALRMGYIDREALLRLADPIANSTYGAYLREIAASGAGRHQIA